jgi:hypothetical protein
MTKRIHLDFLVIGAQKAGTTSLHDWLVQHHDLLLPDIKETHFFSHNESFKKGNAWYISQFVSKAADRLLMGEVDPEYLFSANAPERIRIFADVKKFIIILRSPLERAYSQYLMSVRRGFEKLSFDEAIFHEDSRIRDGGAFALDHFSYLSRSLYYEQIQRYMSVFPNGDFFFVKFEDLFGTSAGDGFYEELSSFIGSSYDVKLVDRRAISNKASTPRFNWIRDLIYRKGERSIMRRLLASVFSDRSKLRIFMLLDKYNQKRITTAKLNKVTNFNLESKKILKILEDLENVERITSLSLGDWKTSLRSDFLGKRGDFTGDS